MDPYAGQTPANVTEAIRGFITYLRHLHAAVMARVMKNNMDLSSLLRDSTTVTIEAMFGVMRENTETETQAALRRMREVMGMRPPDQANALRAWGVTGAIETLETALNNEANYARKCLHELRDTIQRNRVQHTEVLDSTVATTVVTFMRKVANLLLDGKSITEALLEAGREALRPHVTEAELTDMKYDVYLRGIHWSVAEERRVLAPVGRPITGAGLPEPQVTPTNLYATMQSIIEPMMGAMLQTMLDRMGSVTVGREAILLQGSVTGSGASGTTTSSAARPGQAVPLAASVQVPLAVSRPATATPPKSTVTAKPAGSSSSGGSSSSSGNVTYLARPTGDPNWGINPLTGKHSGAMMAGLV